MYNQKALNNLAPLYLHWVNYIDHLDIFLLCGTTEKDMVQDPSQHCGMLCHMTLKIVLALSTFNKDLKKTLLLSLFDRFFFCVFTEICWCCKVPLNIKILVLHKILHSYCTRITWIT